MKLDKNSILHIPLSNYAFGIDENTLDIRIRVRLDNVKKIYLNYGDTAYPSEKVVFTRVEMKKICSDLSFDYYENVIENTYHRVVYYFEIVDLENNVYYYYADNFYKEISDNRNDLYKFPYLRREDVGIPPKWFRFARFYNIFPDSFKIKDSTKYENKVLLEDGIEIKNKIGGTLNDVLNKLDYIKSLGFNGIYLNPIFKAGEYHKYDTIDYFKVDPLLGSDEDLINLVNKAHSLNIKVVIDLVLNHSGWYFFAFDDVVKNQEKSKYVDWFYKINFPLYRPKTQNELPPYECFGYERLMPKLNTDNDEVIEYFSKLLIYLIDKFKIDGFRLDTSDEVNDYFWISLNRLIKKKNKEIVLIGEIWQNPEHWLNSLMFDSAMNYCLRKNILDLFKYDLSSKEFNSLISKLLVRNKKNYLYSLFNFLSTHDTPRVISLLNDDEDKFILAYSFIYTFMGAISILYGEEEPIRGIKEEDYRKAINFEKELRFAGFFKEMNEIRENFDALASGEYIALKYDETSLYIYERVNKTQKILVILNLSSKKIDITDLNIFKDRVIYCHNFDNNILSRYGVIILNASND